MFEAGDFLLTSGVFEAHFRIKIFLIKKLVGGEKFFQGFQIFNFRCAFVNFENYKLQSFKRYCTPEKQKKHAIYFFQLKHLQKIWLLKKPQDKITFRSKFMAAFVFSLWRHIWQTIKIGTNFLYNSILHRNKRLLISGKVFVNLLENWCKMRKIIV